MMCLIRPVKLKSLISMKCLPHHLRISMIYNVEETIFGKNKILLIPFCYKNTNNLASYFPNLHKLPQLCKSNRQIHYQSQMKMKPCWDHLQKVFSLKKFKIVCINQ